MKLPQQDKLLHLISGIYIFLWVDLILPSIVALGMAVAIGIAKELYYDKKLGKGTPELADALYTIGGALSVYLLTL